MDKKVLILGASNAQIDAINYCKSQGYYVCGCSYTTKDSGIPLLDCFKRVDIKDVGGVAAFAREQNVDVIYSIGSDLAIPTIMKVSEAMNLPHFVSSETAEICHSKHLMRLALGTDFRWNIHHIVCETLDEALQYSDFPGMMKPVDSQGQRGCFRVDSPEDIIENFNASFEYSIIGKVIIETYIEGPEFSANAYLENDKLIAYFISDRYSFHDYPGGIVRGHRLPSAVIHGEEAESEIRAMICETAAKLGIHNGPCYIQFKLERDGHPVILEIAPRLDGCHMWNLIRHYCGVDLLAACFEHLLIGSSGLTMPAELPATALELEFMCQETNTILNRNAHNLDDAIFHSWYYQTGDRVKKVNGYIEKCGYLIRQVPVEGGLK